ncbi:hypothetical protein KH0155_24730 [Helicobacter pylori]
MAMFTIKTGLEALGLNLGIILRKGKIFFTFNDWFFKIFYVCEKKKEGPPPPPRKFERGERNEGDRKSQLWG